MTSLRAIAALALLTWFGFAKPVHAQVNKPRPRIFILMVWDGLRPDSVSATATPNLFDLQRDGVHFAHHHSVYPTLTMVNAAAMATGAAPAANGIFGDAMDLMPALHQQGQDAAARTLGDWVNGQIDLENSQRLSALNGPKAFAGRLLQLDTIAQQVESQSGYLAVIGKSGPTFLFDNRVTTVANGRDSLFEPHGDYLFVSDDLVEPESARKPDAPEMKLLRDIDDAIARDDYFTRVVTEQALPGAKKALLDGRAALIVLWLHDPDFGQHRAGLGTLPMIRALSGSDQDLGRVRSTIETLAVSDSTDLMVVSDHGFGTLKVTLNLAGLLVKAGIKKSPSSDDIVVAQNGGTDLVYLSREAFPTVPERHQVLQRIVDFAIAQDWCGPIFSEPGPFEPGPHSRPYLGWIDGTFSEAAAGLFSSSRAPDLIISMAENPEEENQQYTGSDNPAFALGVNGQQPVPNSSQPLVHPMQGMLYGDESPKFTTGMGMHGSAGERELHNFCAAYGPDFRKGFTDLFPTGNIDVGPTIIDVLQLMPNIGPKGLYASGRDLDEAMVGGHHPGAPHSVMMTAQRELQGVRVTARLRFTQLGGAFYLDSSSMERTPLGSSP